MEVQIVSLVSSPAERIDPVMVLLLISSQVSSVSWPSSEGIDR